MININKIIVNRLKKEGIKIPEKAYKFIIDLQSVARLGVIKYYTNNKKFLGKVYFDPDKYQSIKRFLSKYF